MGDGMCQKAKTIRVRATQSDTQDLSYTVLHLVKSRWPKTLREEYTAGVPGWCGIYIVPK